MGGKGAKGPWWGCGATQHHGELGRAAPALLLLLVPPVNSGP